MHGGLEVRECAGVVGFAELLKGLTQANALIYGVPKRPGVRELYSTATYVKADKPAHAATRTNEDTTYADGPGIVTALLPLTTPPSRAPSRSLSKA